jgi:hypothetical protein
MKKELPFKKTFVTIRLNTVHQLLRPVPSTQQVLRAVVGPEIIMTILGNNHNAYTFSFICILCMLPMHIYREGVKT